MSSETTNTGGQPAEAEPFSKWLMRTATDRGYDVEPGGGGRSALARAAKVSPAQIGRALDGHATPSTDTLRALARPLGVTYAEMLFRAGLLTAVDVAEVMGEVGEPSEADIRTIKFPREMSPEEMISTLGVTDPADQAVVLAVIERLRSREAEPPRSRSHVQRGVGGHPRPHEVKADEPGE